mgnify:CR=1 FL=1
MRQDRGVNGDAQRIEQLGWMLFLKIFDDQEQELEAMRSDYISPIPKELKWRTWASDDEWLTWDDLLRFIDDKLFPTLRNITIAEGDIRASLVQHVFAENNNYMKSGVYIRQICNLVNSIDFTTSKDRHVFGDIYENILKELQSAGSAGEFYTPRAVTEFMTEMIDPKLGESIMDPACGTGWFLVNTIEHIRRAGSINTIEDIETLNKTIQGTEYKPLPYMLAVTNLILHGVESPAIRYDDSLAVTYHDIKRSQEVDVILANPPFGGMVAHGNEKNFPETYRTKESADLFLLLFIRYLKHGGRCAIVLPDGSLTGDGVKERIRKKLLEDCNLHTIIRLPNSVFQPYATVATNLLFFEKGTPTKDVWYYEHRLPEWQKSYSKTKAIELREFNPIKTWWNDRKESDISWKVSINFLKEHWYDLDIKNPTKKEEIEELTSKEIIEKMEASFEKMKILLESIKA